MLHLEAKPDVGVVGCANRAPQNLRITLALGLFKSPIRGTGLLLGWTGVHFGQPLFAAMFLAAPAW